MRDKAIAHIFSIASLPNAMEKMEKTYLNMNKIETLNFNIEVGVIPERFDHDSTEEKLWSKLSDIVLARALNFLGLDSTVIKARADSADVLAKNKKYSLVGDAKAFRLSRTAKNQKDFKVESLSKWRGKNDYALLVCPVYQYPVKKSQIYQQAINRNVCLLSYIHLNYLIENYNGQDLSPLWDVSGTLKKGNIDFKNSITYWKALDTIVSSLTNTKLSDLIEYKNIEFDRAKRIAKDEIDFWNSVKRSFNDLSKEEAIKHLIKAKKIDEKISTITKSILNGKG